MSYAKGRAWQTVGAGVSGLGRSIMEMALAEQEREKEERRYQEGIDWRNQRAEIEDQRYQENRDWQRGPAWDVALESANLRTQAHPEARPVMIGDEQYYDYDPVDQGIQHKRSMELQKQGLAVQKERLQREIDEYNRGRGITSALGPGFEELARGGSEADAYRAVMTPYTDVDMSQPGWSVRAEPPRRPLPTGVSDIGELSGEVGSALAQHQSMRALGSQRLGAAQRNLVEYGTPEEARRRVTFEATFPMQEGLDMDSDSYYEQARQRQLIMDWMIQTGLEPQEAAQEYVRQFPESSDDIYRWLRVARIPGY